MKFRSFYFSTIRHLFNLEPFQSPSYKLTLKEVELRLKCERLFLDRSIKNFHNSLIAMGDLFHSYYHQLLSNEKNEAPETCIKRMPIKFPSLCYEFREKLIFDELFSNFRFSRTFLFSCWFTVISHCKNVITVPRTKSYFFLVFR